MSPKKPPSRKLSTSGAELDASELLHLAIRAMRGGQDEDALGLLQQAIERDPKNGNPHHIRGAILASQGEVTKAIEAMTQALALDPQLMGARFQLGLLHFTSGNVLEAQSVWQAFDELDALHPMRLFKTGMLHLAKDEFENCVATLEQGIALSNVESINQDMRRVIEKARAFVPAKPPEIDPSGARNNPRHVLLAGYDKTAGDEKKT